MALPASGPISSSMIAAEFSSSQAPSGPNISLGGLGTKLGTPIIYGNQVLMGSSFYGQSAGVSVTEFTGGTLETDTSNACRVEEPENTYYHDGSGTEPAVGDTVYTDDPGTVTLGAGAILFVDSEFNRLALTINSSGEITSTTGCR
jgi:hypothetical protein